MRKGGYYSVRTGKNTTGAQLDLPALKRLYLSLLRDFDERFYLQSAYGYHCVDQGFVPGTLGAAVADKMFLALRKDHLFPTHEKIEQYSEDDLFDVIEFEFDQVAKPIKGHYHDYSGCGWHYHEFDVAAGREDFRAALDPYLASYASGFQLTADGEIESLAADGMQTLVDAVLPASTPKNVTERVASARTAFFRRGSTIDDRRHALKDLADVLEFLRPQVSQVLDSKDEGDLFNIANNFGVRHHNAKQKTNYDPAIWLSWMYYYYLATIHASLRLLEKSKG